jgi:UDP-glucose 4-epimerase
MMGKLAAIVPATIRRIKSGEKPVVEGDGLQTRDFVYVDDTVRALILAYESEESRRKVINIGSGVETSINELVREICSYYKYKGEIERLPARPANVKHLRASSVLASDVLGFTPRTSFKEGIKTTMDWYEKNYF